MYQLHGDEGLSMKSGTYSGEFKIHVVKYLESYLLSSYNFICQIKHQFNMFEELPSYASLLVFSCLGCI